MKRLFNRTKRPVPQWDESAENDYEWDEADQMEGEDGAAGEEFEYEESADEEETPYKEASAPGEETGEIVWEDEAYGEENPEETGYGEDGAAGEEIEYEASADEEETPYEEASVPGEETGEIVWEDATYGEENPEETGYGEDGALGETIEYGESANEEETPYEEESGLFEETGRETTGKKRRRGFAAMGTMDRLIFGTGAAVLVLALVTLGFYLKDTFGRQQISGLETVGNQLEGIDVIGGSGLLAVADAQIARMTAASVVDEMEEPEPEEEYEESDYRRDVTVTMEFVSIEKDLKIKFVNDKTHKLVANVPFAVKVTDPDGKNAVWSDDDMDGVIYKKDITPGKYKVAMEELEDEKYAGYTLSTMSRTVEVKAQIAYEKVEVANEIKTEDEVNASKEDTAQNDTVVESVLQDTVAWVESNVIPGAYVEVLKKDILDPMERERQKAVSAQAFLGNRQIVTVSGGDASPSPDPTASPTPTPEALQIKIEPGQVTTTVNGAVTAQVTLVSPAALPQGVSVAYAFEGGNSSFGNAYVQASVDATGRISITGKAAISSTQLVIVAKYSDGSQETRAALNVTVNPAKTITLDKNSFLTFVGETLQINAAVSDCTVLPNLTAVSSNGGVATVGVSATEIGKAVISITGQTEGTSDITLKLQEGSPDAPVTAAELTFQVTVKAHPKTDSVTKLTDQNTGLQLYVEESSGSEKKFREATYADYYTDNIKFYTLTEVKYTGWQNIDGKVYYYTAEGNYVTGEQVIQGAKYNFASDGTLVTGSGMLGIDVSKWNGNIDWGAVKNSGVNYAIIRCGYRGSSAGSLIEDPRYRANIQGATAAGLKVGIYFFTQALDEREAVEEASMVLELVKNYRISYPIFLDVESSGGRADGLDRATRTAVCRAFCQTIQSNGYTAGIYANKNWLENKLDPSALSAYKIWLAQYAKAPTYGGRYELWQYSSEGSISGISGHVDMNLSYLGY